MSPASVQLWRITGVLVLIGIEALLFGFSYPFFSLALEKREIANWLIGLNASLAGAGILFLGPFLPKLIDRFGLSKLVAAQFAISLLSFAAIALYDHLVVWFIARFIMGACFSSLWTTTEIWLNGVVDDRRRGRIIGASGTLYAACQFVGPLMLGWTGATGPLPLLAAMLPLAVGVAIALSIRSAVGEAEDEGHGDTRTLATAIRLAAALVAAAFLTGLGETAMQSLLPLYGLAHGLDDAGASRLVAIFSLGEAVLVVLLGWLADKAGRRITLLGTTVVAVATTLTLPVVIDTAVLAAPVLFVAGGAVSGLYTLGVILIGTDFRGQRLAIVSTGFAMSYSAGSILGATPIGFLIDLSGVEALPLSIAVGFALLFLFLLWQTRPRPAGVIAEDREG